MEIRNRVVAAVSAAAITGALAVAVIPATAAASAGPGVTFSSQPDTAPLVAYYVVHPAGHQSQGSGVASDSRTVSLNPKTPRLLNSDAGSFNLAGIAGVTSDNTVSAGQNGGSGNGGGTPSPSHSFIGQQGSSTTCSYFPHGCNPPDMALAASPSLVLQGVNTQWEVLDTAGHVQDGWPVSAQNFFGAPNATNPDGSGCDAASNNQPFLSDPRALYDPIDHRFWAAMLQVENAIGIAPGCPFKSVYYVSVSQTSDPSGAWNVYVFDMDGGKTVADMPVVADYTQLGLNGQAVYFSANMYAQDGSFFAYAELYEANKSQMEHGRADFAADGFFNMQANGPGLNANTGPFLADTVHPTMNIDGSAGGAEYFADTLDGPDPVSGSVCGLVIPGFSSAPCSGLALWKLTNPTGHDNGGAAPRLKGIYVPNVKPYVFSPPADEPTCNQCVDALDLRITGTPVVRDGVLSAAWETGLNNGTTTVPGIEWAQVRLDEPSSQDSARSGYYNFSGDTAASFGTLMPEANGSLAMLFERMGSTVNPETRYIVRKPGQPNFMGSGVLLKAGESSYRPTLCGTAALPVCRWGDFEAASFDGQGNIWFAGEYANAFQGVSTPPAFGRNWGTWIGAIRAS